MISPWTPPPLGPRQPIFTERLILRPLAATDSIAVHQIISRDEDIYRNTLKIPKNYTLEDAENFIRIFSAPSDTEFVFAITLLSTGELIGCCGLHVTPVHYRAEIGYWISSQHRSLGFTSEAARALLRYGFTTLNLNRIQAFHFLYNPASGAVMRKIGMRHEANFLQYLLKDGKFVNAAQYSILKSDWLQLPN